MSSNLTMTIAGGGLIGLSAVLLMLFNGRILGVSGIASNLISGSNYSRKYSVAFVLGVLVTAKLGMEINPLLLPGPLNMSLPWMILAGMLVGFGTRLANGCTSGHGVCGVADGSDFHFASPLGTQQGSQRKVSQLATKVFQGVQPVY